MSTGGMISGGTETGTKRLGQVGAELERLRKLTEILDGSISGLEMRIQVILTPAKSLAGGDNGKEPSEKVVVPLASGIKGIADCLTATSCRINDICERVEL